MKSGKYYVYFMTNKRKNVLYVGVTNNIERRVGEHKSGLIDGFTARYRLDKCVMVEEYSSIKDALEREKQIKSWSRERKFNLIRETNPELRDYGEE